MRSVSPTCPVPIAQWCDGPARLHSSIANPFFGVGVQSDLMNSDINALYASQPDLIMGDRDYSPSAMSR